MAPGSCGGGDLGPLLLGQGGRLVIARVGGRRLVVVGGR